MYEGTFKPNRRPVVSTAPDCLVYINGELSLPSGANPSRRVNLQPFIHSVTCSLSTQGQGQASIELHIPAHAIGDVFSAGQLVLTTMMEVHIYMKGHFTVGGAPQYYPVFWGMVTDISESYGGGEQSVSLSCNDILHWWNIQQISHNPSFLNSDRDQQKKFNLTGSIFTGKNPFSIMYTLARQVYGDSMNMRDLSISGRDFRSGLRPEEQRRQMAYWSLRWGRIATALRMFGPTGQVLQGDLLKYALDDNRVRLLKGVSGSAPSKESKFYDPFFKQGDINFAEITPYTLIFSQLRVNSLTSSEFDTKMNVANQVKETIGYEFYMDSTGELIFKPPFYNLDVRPNFPVSWIRDIDVISWNFSEKEPEMTFIDATGFMFANAGLANGEATTPKATYIDYRLVQKFGWRPGSFSSEFIGSDDFGSQRALFSHLVDLMDRNNAGMYSGSTTIPLRPELRLGYPVYVESKDAYYYVEGIQHTFSYGSRCTTSLTLTARRQKFYAAFDAWEREGKEPKPGDIVEPGLLVQNMYKRTIDERTGNPVGDRNVVLKYVPKAEEDQYNVDTFKEANIENRAATLQGDLVSMRSQFGLEGSANKYLYVIDPKRDEKSVANEFGARSMGPTLHIESDEHPNGIKAAIFPVSDENGYEVFGAYEYGRRVTLDGSTFGYAKREEDIHAEALLRLEPTTIDGVPSANSGAIDRIATTNPVDVGKDSNFMVNPNSYGRLLSDIRPVDAGPSNLVGTAMNEANRLESSFPVTVAEPVTSTGSTSYSATTSLSTTPSTAQSKFTWGATFDGVTAQSKGKIVKGKLRQASFSYNSNVLSKLKLIQNVRNELGISATIYPDDLVLAFIHVESAGSEEFYNRKTPIYKNGKKIGEKPAQFYGMFQIGRTNAADIKDNGVPRKNTDMMDDRKAAIHFFQYMEKYRKGADRHNGDFDKMAILWKAGPGTLRNYNKFEKSNPSEAERAAWLHSKIANTDEYLSRKAAALWVWQKKLGTGTVDVPFEGPLPQEIPFVGPLPQETGITDEAYIDDPDRFVLLDEVFEEDDSLQVQLFEGSLNANLGGGINALPTNIRPPRDPSVVPIITEFLLNLYAQAFQDGKERERELRGETRYIPRVPNLVSVPTITKPQKEFVNTPLARDEVREALDRGETVSSLFRKDGAVTDLENKISDVNTAASRLQNLGGDE